jgi:hypothetical protein
VRFAVFEASAKEQDDKHDRTADCSQRTLRRGGTPRNAYLRAPPLLSVLCGKSVVVVVAVAAVAAVAAVVAVVAVVG